MQTVLITGAARGIGFELCRQFSAKGCHVIATCRGEVPEQLSQICQVEALEVTSSASIEQLAKRLSNTPIDLLINNAGIIGPEKQSLNELDISGWLETFHINSIAPLTVSKALLPNLQLSKNPRIITISSQMGALNLASTGMYAYRSSKAAVNKVMQVLSQELKAHGISVCPMHPGWVKTDMGGSNADITAQASAQGIVEFAEQMTLANSGKFYTYKGDEHPW